MADIRPPQWPVVRTPAAPPAAKTDARLEAQRAFFQAAMAGNAPLQRPTTVAASQPAPSNDARKPDLHVQIPPEEPRRILRPGSLVDIKV